jgi:hypothetical protein
MMGKAVSDLWSNAQSQLEDANKLWFYGPGCTCSNKCCKTHREEALVEETIKKETVEKGENFVKSRRKLVEKRNVLAQTLHFGACGISDPNCLEQGHKIYQEINAFYADVKQHSQAGRDLENDKVLFRIKPIVVPPPYDLENGILSSVMDRDRHGMVVLYILHDVALRQYINMDQQLVTFMEHPTFRYYMVLGRILLPKINQYNRFYLQNENQKEMFLVSIYYRQLASENIVDLHKPILEIQCYRKTGNKVKLSALELIQKSGGVELSAQALRDRFGFPECLSFPKSHKFEFIFITIFYHEKEQSKNIGTVQGMYVFWQGINDDNSNGNYRHCGTFCVFRKNNKQYTLSSARYPLWKGQRGINNSIGPINGNSTFCLPSDCQEYICGLIKKHEKQ